MYHLNGRSCKILQIWSTCVIQSCPWISFAALFLNVTQTHIHLKAVFVIMFIGRDSLESIFRTAFQCTTSSVRFSDDFQNDFTKLCVAKILFRTASYSAYECLFPSTSEHCKITSNILLPLKNCFCMYNG